MSRATNHRGTTLRDSTPGPRTPRWILAAPFLLAALGPVPSSAQGPEPGFPVEWSKVEPHEKTLAYRKNLVDGIFEDAERAYLVNNVLPQLGLPANRASIDRVRRRIREVFCAEAGSEAKALEMAMRTTLDAMKAVAANDQAEPVVRVNAILLIGELRAKGKPWPPAADLLVGVLGDPKTPAALRVAAAAGLSRHVEAAAAPATLGPILVKLVTSPVQEGGTEADHWLAGRALAMLAQVGPSAPPDASAAAARVLGDATRPLDVRVRAAAALGACVQPATKVDAGKAVKTIRELAVQSLRDGQPADDSIEPTDAASPSGSKAAAQPQVPVLVCRRAAWRLAMLARALQGDDGSGGIATIAGGEAQAARDMAAALRKAATAIDTTPDGATLAAALAELTNQPAPAANGTPRPAQPERPDAEATPFANPFGK